MGLCVIKISVLSFSCIPYLLHSLCAIPDCSEQRQIMPPPPCQMSRLTRHNWEKGRMINKSNGHNRCSDTDRCSLVWPRHYYWQTPTPPHPHHHPTPTAVSEKEREGGGALSITMIRNNLLSASLSISKRTRQGQEHNSVRWLAQTGWGEGGMISWRWRGPWPLRPCNWESGGSRRMGLWQHHTGGGVVVLVFSLVSISILKVLVFYSTKSVVLFYGILISLNWCICVLVLWAVLVL